MIGLVGAELSRLRSRRMALVTGIALIVAIGLFQLVVNYAVTPPSPAEVSQAQSSAARDHAQWQQSVQDCVTQGGTQQDCESQFSEPTAADYLRPTATFAEVAPIAVEAAAFLSLFASFLVCASFVGAEYSTGSMANWLTFVPRRLTVYGSKLSAVVLASAASGAVVCFGTLGLAVAVTRAHGGSVDGMAGVAALGGRAVVMSAAGGILGFVLALLSRHTVAAVGFLLAYVVVSGGLNLVGLFVPALSGLPPWMPDRNVRAFLEHGSSYSVPSQSANGAPLEKAITFGHSAVYWLVLLIAFVVGGALVFRRRDVT